MARVMQFLGYFLTSANLTMLMTLACRGGFIPVWLFLLIGLILILIAIALQTTYGRREFARLTETAPAISAIIGAIFLAGFLFGLVGGMV